MWPSGWLSALQRPLTLIKQINQTPSPPPSPVCYKQTKNSPLARTLSDRVLFSEAAPLTSSRWPTCSTLAKPPSQCPAPPHARRACPTIQPTRDAFNPLNQLQSCEHHRYKLPERVNSGFASMPGRGVAGCHPELRPGDRLAYRMPS